MTRIVWSAKGRREYQFGVDRGVLYPPDSAGVPWNGLISVDEKPRLDFSEAFLDGIKYRRPKKLESFSATLTAFTYPEEFVELDGYLNRVSSQRRRSFGLCYRTRVGSDASEDLGYKLHLVYNVSASPTVRVRQPSDQDPAPFSWELTTKPITIPGYSPFAHIIVDSTISRPEPLKALEDILYGAEGPATLPLPLDVLETFEINSVLRIIDNGDGTWTAIGPEDVIEMLDISTFQINWPSAVYISGDTYNISSL